VVPRRVSLESPTVWQLEPNRRRSLSLAPRRGASRCPRGRRGAPAASSIYSKSNVLECSSTVNKTVIWSYKTVSRGVERVVVLVGGEELQQHRLSIRNRMFWNVLAQSIRQSSGHIRQSAEAWSESLSSWAESSSSSIRLLLLLLLLYYSPA